MKKLLVLLCACGMLLSACGVESSVEISLPEETTTAAMTTGTSLTPAPAATDAQTLPPEMTETTIGTTTATPQTTTIATTAAAIISTQSAATTRQEGGQGGEEHGDEPHPLYFNYRFAPDYFSMRLAGGNYQTIEYNLEEALEHGVEELYTLDDFMFDGTPDLCIPVSGFDTPNVKYAVFTWDRDSEKFDEKPYLFVNPVCHADTKEIFTLEQSSEDGSEVCTVNVYGWRAGTNSIVPKVIRKYTADFTALTLSAYSLEGDAPDTPTVTEYDTKEALEQAVLDLYLIA